jgi:hypothetical protein
MITAADGAFILGADTPVPGLFVMVSGECMEMSVCQ